MKNIKHFAALAVCVLAVGCQKPADTKQPADSVTEEATAPAAGDSGVGAVNRARSTADKASSQTYKGEEGGK